MNSTAKASLKKLDLKDRTILEQFRAQLEEVILTQEVERAYLFSLVLRNQLHQNPDLKRIDEDVYTEYQRMVVKAQWISLLLMRKEEVRGLLKENLVEALEMKDLGILGKLRGRLLVELDILERDTYKKELLSDLKSNTQTLTKEIIRSDESKFLPTVEQWIQEYIREVGSENIRDRLKQAQFFSANPNVKKLSEEEKRRLELVIHIHERLMTPSSTKEGIEEAIPIDDPKRPGVLRGGVFEEIKPDEMRREFDNAQRISDEIQKTFKYTPPASCTEQARTHIAQMPFIGEYVADLIRAVGGNTYDIPKKFIEALKVKDKNHAIAALYFLGENRKLKNFLSEHTNLREKVKVFIVQDILNTTAGLFVDKNSQDPSVMQGFFKYALQDQLGLAEYEAGLHANDIGSSIGPEYAHMAYPDPEKKSYVWTKTRMEGDKLILEKPPVTEAEEEETVETGEEDASGERLEELLEFAKKRMKETFVAESVLMGKVGENAVELKKQLVNALKTRDANKAVGALLILSKIGKLQQALRESGNWRETLKNHIADKYNSQALKEFVEKNPTDPTVVSEFLQYVLQDRLGFKESEAAVVGMEVGDRMGGKYQTISAADEENNMFSWIPNKVVDGKLVQEV